MTLFKIAGKENGGGGSKKIGSHQAPAGRKGLGELPEAVVAQGTCVMSL